MTVSLWNPRGDNHVTGLTWGQRVGEPACPYIRRWVLNVAGVGSLRLHHWTASDDSRFLHDHAWPFTTLILRGGYTDITEEMCTMCAGGGCMWCSGTGSKRYGEYLSAGMVRHRPAQHVHSVRVEPGGCWTLMLTGPVVRDWGFWVDGEWKRMRRFFKEHGHHPCD